MIYAYLKIDFYARGEKDAVSMSDTIKRGGKVEWKNRTKIK